MKDFTLQHHTCGLVHGMAHKLYRGYCCSASSHSLQQSSNATRSAAARGTPCALRAATVAVPPHAIVVDGWIERMILLEGWASSQPIHVSCVQQWCSHGEGGVKEV